MTGNGSSAEHYRHDRERYPAVIQGKQKSGEAPVYFFPDPLSPALDNSALHRCEAHETENQKFALYALSEEYRDAVEEEKKAKLKKANSLLDHDVLQQLSQMARPRMPIFTVGVSCIQTLLLIYTHVLGYQRTGNISETGWSFPPFSPNTWVLVSLGAKFNPCMRREVDFPQDPLVPITKCLPGMAHSPETNKCSLADICGSFLIPPPKQITRLITAILLHSGPLHFLLNVVVFQLIILVPIERDIGSLRAGFIYLISGIAGFLLDPTTPKPNVGKSPVVGASGAIYGVVSCILIDLFFNWRLLKSPRREVMKLLAQVIVSLSLGFILPHMDNFAHLGGLVAGLFSSMFVLPSIHVGSWDRIGKRIVRIVSLPLLVVYISLLALFFATDGYSCDWCAYLSCPEIIPWCKTELASV